MNLDCDEYHKFVESQNIKRFSDVKPVIDKSDSVYFQYKKVYDHYEYLGIQRAILFQTGDFFELYSIEINGLHTTNILKLTDILNLHLIKPHADKQLNDKNPFKAGFQIKALSKYRTKLLDVGFTVILVEQNNIKKLTERATRRVTEIITPGVNIHTHTYKSNNLVVLYIENQKPKQHVSRFDKYELSIGVASLDVTTNESIVYETYSSQRYQDENALEEIYRLLSSINCSEIVIYLEGFTPSAALLTQLPSLHSGTFVSKEGNKNSLNVINDKGDKNDEEQLAILEFNKKLVKYFTSALDLQSYNVHEFVFNEVPQLWTTVIYQEKALTKLFNISKVGHDALSFLNLESVPMATIAYILMVEYVRQRNNSLLKKLSKPIQWNPKNCLVLTHNAIQQLDILPNLMDSKKQVSLYDIINNTVTNGGKRLLETCLTRPYMDKDYINQSYDNIDMLIKNRDIIDIIGKHFRNIVDLDRYHRRAELQSLSPNFLSRLVISYKSIIDLYDVIKDKFNSLIDKISLNNDMVILVKLYENLCNTFRLEALEQCKKIKRIDVNLFKPGVVSVLDELESKVTMMGNDINGVAKALSKILEPYFSDEELDKLVTIVEPKKGGKYFEIRSRYRGVYEYYINKIQDTTNTENAKNITIAKYDSVLDLVAEQYDKITGDEFKTFYGKFKHKIKQPKTTLNLTAYEKSLLLSLTFTTYKNKVKIFTSFISKIENNNEEDVDKFIEEATYYYNSFVSEIFSRHIDTLNRLSKWIAHIDVIRSNAITAIKRNYHRPTIVDNQFGGSHINAKAARHPIVEYIQDDIKFIPNDIVLGKFILQEETNHSKIQSDIVLGKFAPQEKTQSEKEEMKHSKIQTSNGLFLFSTNNCGKCLGGDVEILMADGQIKQACDIKLYDTLIGDDGTVRIVIGTTKGHGPMYNIKQYNKRLQQENILEQGFDCNDKHNLVFEACSTISLPKQKDTKENYVQVNELKLKERKIVHSGKRFTWNEKTRAKTMIMCNSEEEAMFEASYYSLIEKDRDNVQCTISADEIYNLNKKENTKIGETILINKTWQKIRRPVEKFPIEFNLKELIYRTFCELKIILPRGIFPMLDTTFAYYMGLWLGDGTSNNLIEIHQCEELYPEVVIQLKRIADICGLKLLRVINCREKNCEEKHYHKQIIDIDDIGVQKHKGSKICYMYRLTNGDTIKDNSAKTNLLCVLFKKLGMNFNNSAKGKKFIPHQLLSTSKEVRLALLAGLLDTDGYYDKMSYEITQERKELSFDILRLSRSLGFKTNIRKKKVISYPDNDYYRVNILGDNLYQIPCQIRSKVAIKPVTTRPRSELRYSATITKKEDGDYYGFQLAMLEDITLDEFNNALKTINNKEFLISQLVLNDLLKLSTNDCRSINGRYPGRFLLGDFTVTHNSVYIKTTGLNLIMAQCGMFVAAEKFEYSLFSNIITRLSGNDNMSRRQGTFAVEMAELTTIMNQSSPNSLILGDEICHGTEHLSALSIVASSTIRLCQKRTNFIFSTHLRLLPQLPEFDELTVVDENNYSPLRYMHFLINFTNDKNDAIFEHKLLPGLGENLYGIEIAEMMGLDNETCNIAYKIRNRLEHPDTYDVPIGGIKQSRYNRKYILGLCSIDGCDEKAVDTHHIREQSEANSDGNIDHFNKNTLHNLSGLCKTHHIQHHQGKIKIDGYKQTSSGIKFISF